ncbi:unnamed protein product [Didymodactylos carnosus]|uniref:AAA+ ATPase domain-containing protein n=1 Tax=Didymodactylos carnosus TaxID=1234261 RepID=A0A8S2R3C6_9BILA|nr:unnamed protein product [Didymodactylos carnosus]CAF4141782.1 unnamed protein product [Didymodactylos carnosus]
MTARTVTFADVAGLDQAKAAIKEAIILPIKYSHLFDNKFSFRYAPGTGKTYLAKAIAGEYNCTFISVNSLDLLSKWFGGSRNSVPYLFELARKRQPTILFIDDIDLLYSTKDESEEERQIRIQFCLQIQDVMTMHHSIILLAATNTPWILHSSVIRQFNRRIYIPMPEVSARLAMFKSFIGSTPNEIIDDNEWNHLAEATENYTGADILVVTRNALFRPIRRLLQATHFKRIKNSQPDRSDLWAESSSTDPDAVALTLDKIDEKELYVPPVTMNDMLDALSTQMASIQISDLEQYQKFTEEYG